jgi:hypothetical protein
LNLKTKTKSPDVDAPHVDMTSNWGSQLIEWMSPKSKQIVLKTNEQEKDENEKTVFESNEDNVPARIDEEKVVQNDIQEGTEIALTNFECSADDTKVKRPRYFSSKRIFAKSLRAPFKQTKTLVPATVPSRKHDDAELNGVVKKKPDVESVKHDPMTRSFTFRRFLRTNAKVASKSEKNKTTVDASDDSPLKSKNSDKQVKPRKPPSNKSLNTQTNQARPPNPAKKLASDDDMVESQPMQVDAVENHSIAGNGQNENIDSDVESSVKYLEFVKNKRQSRNRKIENGPDNPTAMESGFNGGNDIEYQYRVNAVSDEAVEDTKSSVSVTTSSIVDSSFLSSINEKTEDEEKIDSKLKPEKKMVPRKVTATTRAKKGMPSTKTNRSLSRRKEDDSVGVSLNSNNINSFNDDLSVAFAPAVGKWLW